MPINVYILATIFVTGNMEYNKLVYKIYSIINYSDNTGMAIIINIREIMTVEFWSLVLLYRARGR